MQRRAGGDIIAVGHSTNYAVLSIEDMWDGTYRVTYLPLAQTPPVAYAIPVTINGVNADGGLFDPTEMAQLAITATGPGLQRAVSTPRLLSPWRQPWRAPRSRMPPGCVSGGWCTLLATRP